MNLQEHLSEIPDFRRHNQNFKHELLDILMLSICAIFSGAEDFEEIEYYGEQKLSFLQKFIPLTNGVPSHDTIRRVFMLLDSSVFNSKFMSWIQDVTTSLNIDYKQISIDGKTLRGSKSNIHLVSAVASNLGLCLGQVKVNEKSNEITAIPDLLSLLHLKGCIVTIDAMGCQKKICDQIVEAEADYFIALKKNQQTLHTNVSQQLRMCKKAQTYQKTLYTGNHNEPVTYKVTVTKQKEWFDQPIEWPSLFSMVKIETIRDAATEIRYYISSLKTLTCKEALEYSIGHWSIENQLHWQLDVTLKEDEKRLRKGFSAENFSLLRKMLLNTAYLHKEKVSKKKLIKRMAWDEQFFLEMLGKLFNLS